MSGQECPACEILNDEPACTGAAGCVWHRMQAEAEAARTREARIRQTRDKVLAEVRRWRRERPDFCGGGTNLLGAAADAWLAAEAEGETP